MFYIIGVNITNPTIRLFDAYILQQELTPVGVLVKNVRIQMEPCTDQHFAFGDGIIQQFHAIGGSSSFFHL